MIYEINGKQADLKRVLPLKLGDFEVLEAEGVPLKNMGDLTFKQMRILIAHILKKANGDITDEDVKGLTLDQTLDVQRKINEISAGAKPSIPT